MGDLTRNFSKSEFACKCGNCGGIVRMKGEFMRRLQMARELSDVGYVITSGFRCPIHPETVKRPTSSHPRGWAADISTPNNELYFRVIKGLIGAGFDRIGAGAAFVHVDLDPVKNPFRLWTYYDK